jgi:hypothetical protein
MASRSKPWSRSRPRTLLLFMANRAHRTTLLALQAELASPRARDHGQVVDPLENLEVTSVDALPAPYASAIVYPYLYARHLSSLKARVCLQCLPELPAIPSSAYRSGTKRWLLTGSTRPSVFPLTTYSHDVEEDDRGPLSARPSPRPRVPLNLRGTFKSNPVSQTPGITCVPLSTSSK